MGDRAAQLYVRTAELIRQAVDADAQGQFMDALAHYNIALKSIAELQRECTEQQRPAIEAKFCEYSSRVSQLLRQLSDTPAYHGDLDRAHAALEEARRQNSSGNISVALDLYISGIGSYQRILRLSKTLGTSDSWRRELLKFANACLKEAEYKKQGAAPVARSEPLPLATHSNSSSPMLTVSGCDERSVSSLPSQLSGLSLDPKADARRARPFTKPRPRQNSTPLAYQTPGMLAPSAGAVLSDRSSRRSSTSSIGNMSVSPDIATPSNGSRSGSSSAQSERLTDRETEIVRTTSHVNGLTFLPWLENDSSERFDLHEYFSDRDGLLTLSPKQQRKLWQWRRASQIYGRPQIFGQHGCGHIVQETVTDCSFVAALCVTIEHERRFGRQLITQHMYPRTAQGTPAFNPAGKYMVKLFVNGLWRRVVIDDLLPVAGDGRLLCTYSNMGDIGQSLVEKAFLKVMGGYDFPGSNSSTDLHVLTGWIPEHIFIQDQGFDAQRTWTRMIDGLHGGDVLLTIATGEMSSDVAGSLGLVPSHAYAVLDVREVCGHRLLMVKNPWSSLRWTGKFSHADQTNWTPELMRLLNYSPEAAERDDRGIFWIDFESVCHRFDAIHLNWNPAVFSHRARTHFGWEMGMGPRQAVYDFSANPQYTLTVGGGSSSSGGEQADGSPVWILLSKHLLKTEENHDFIALHVYDGKGGRRIYEPRAAMHIGEYVNTQHVLVRFTATAGERYTLVVAQREKTKALYFTLRALSNAPLGLDEALAPVYREEVHGQWGSASAGGNTVSPRYLDNPQYQLTIHDSTRRRCKGVVALEAAQKHPVNLRVFRGGYLVTRVLEINTVATSGKYRTQFCTCDLDDSLDLEPGCSYTLVASTFEPFMFSKFKLHVGLDCPFTLAPIPREGAGMRLREFHGRWVPGSDDRAGGPVDQCYARNPRFLVRTDRETTIMVRLQTPQAVETLPLVNVSVFAFADAVLGRVCASSGSYTNSPQGVATRTAVIGADGISEYLIVASTWDHDVDTSFVLYFYSAQAVDVTPLWR
ncbi:cysteine protease [Coemansia sp. RSA 552]|nr:cysteine protease [Coemansia sp. RSA 552]